MKTTHLKTLIARGLGGKPSSKHYDCKKELKQAKQEFKSKCENVFKFIKPQFEFMLDDVPTRLLDHTKHAIYDLAKFADKIIRDAANDLSDFEEEHRYTSTGMSWQGAFERICETDIQRWQVYYKNTNKK